MTSLLLLILNATFFIVSLMLLLVIQYNYLSINGLALSVDKLLLMSIQLHACVSNISVSKAFKSVAY